MISTALAAGFDIVAGIVALALVGTQLRSPGSATSAAHVRGSLALRHRLRLPRRRPRRALHGELPRADRRPRPAATAARGCGLAELWTDRRRSSTCSAALVIILILTTHQRAAERHRAADSPRTSTTIHAQRHAGALRAAPIFAGALITAMTWFVEGQESMLVRDRRWRGSPAPLLALGSFNHVIVVTPRADLRLSASAPTSPGRSSSATSSSPPPATCSAGSGS